MNLMISLYFIFGALSLANDIAPFERMSLCSRFLLSKVLYAPDYAQKATPTAEIPRGASEFFLSNLPYRVQVSGIERFNDQPDAPTIVYLYGNAMNMNDAMYSNIHQLDQPDRGYVLFDYPGYGKSRGEISERGLTTATIAVIDWIRERRPRSPILLWGWSLGSAVALQAAQRRLDSVSGLILMSAWSSMIEVIRKLGPTKVPDFLRRYAAIGNRYDSLSAVAKLKTQRVLMIHGIYDEMFPHSMGQELFDRVATSQKLLISPHDGHYIDVYPLANQIESFIKQFVPR